MIYREAYLSRSYTKPKGMTSMEWHVYQNRTEELRRIAALVAATRDLVSDPQNAVFLELAKQALSLVQS